MRHSGSNSHDRSAIDVFNRCCAGRLILQQGATPRLKKRNRLDTASNPSGFIGASSRSTAANRNETEQTTAGGDLIPMSSHTTASHSVQLDEPTLEQPHPGVGRQGEADGSTSGGFNGSQDSGSGELLLVIFAPRKGVLDVFSGRHGPAVLTLPCSSNCRCCLCTSSSHSHFLEWRHVDLFELAPFEPTGPPPVQFGESVCSTRFALGLLYKLCNLICERLQKGFKLDYFSSLRQLCHCFQARLSNLRHLRRLFFTKELPHW